MIKIVLTAFLWMMHSFAVDSSEAVDEGLLHYHKELQQNYQIEYAKWQEASMDSVEMYVSGDVNVRAVPDISGKIIDELSKGDKVIVKAAVYDSEYNDDQYYRVENSNSVRAYIRGDYLISVNPLITAQETDLVKEELNEKMDVYYAEKNGKKEIVGYSLNVDLVYQSPELPQGCEITALTAAMNFMGYNVDKCEMADKFLPKSKTLDADPNEYYLRNPRTNGFYCFSPVIVNTVERYERANKVGITATDISGCLPEKMYETISEGKPVVVWGTLRWNPPYKYSSGLYGNLHCMVLSGYTNNTVTITDSIYGMTKVDRATFESVWKRMGSQAVVVE